MHIYMGKKKRDRGQKGNSHRKQSSGIFNYCMEQLKWDKLTGITKFILEMVMF